MTTTTHSHVDSPVDHRIREVKTHQRADLKVVARLHMLLLSFGPMAALGETFIREVCYRVPMSDELLNVGLYEVAGVPVGFVAFTAQSMSFHRDALKNHWIYALWVLMLSVLRDPRRLVGLVTTLRVMGSRQAELNRGDQRLGEVVCLAVLPEYLTPQFVRKTGLRVSEELVQYAMQHLKQAGLTRMRMIVDADNKVVLLFYHRLGARFEPYEMAGIPSVQVWFDLNEGARSG